MDTFIDPVTRDYLYDAASGALVRDPARGMANAVYLRLMTPLGGWWADATLGSRLHELTREKDVPRVSLLAKQYSEQALKPILDDGRALSISITVDRPHDGRLLLLIQVLDAGGREFTFQHPVKVS